jgi:hypothetical protein
MKIHTDGHLFKKEGTGVITIDDGMKLNCGKCSFSTESKELLDLHITSHELNIQINDLIN